MLPSRRIRSLVTDPEVTDVVGFIFRVALDCKPDDSDDPPSQTQEWPGPRIAKRVALQFGMELEGDLEDVWLKLPTTIPTTVVAGRMTRLH